jgi:hypothetical protein
MNETVLMPDLQASLLCDDVRQERNGKFILIGLFDVIAVPAFPVVIPRMCLVNRWCSGAGAFRQRSRVLRSDGRTVLVEGREVALSLDGPEATATSVEVFMNVRFEGEGVHWIEVLLEGDLKLRYPLRAVVSRPRAETA